MKKTWKDNNMLLKEEWNARHRCYELYYRVVFSYEDEEKRDKAFEYFNDDDTCNYNMAIPKKEGDTQIAVVKYVWKGIGKRNRGENIEEWAHEKANMTGALDDVQIDESSYDEYHDFIDEKEESNLKESRSGGDYAFILTFESEYDRWKAYKKLKDMNLSFRPVLLEQAISYSDFIPRCLEKIADSREALLVNYTSDKRTASGAIMEFLDRVEDKIPKILNIWDEESF